MKYTRFEELPVWQDAIDLAVRVFALTAKPIFRRYPGLRDQIERASVSVSNNIAEGFERGTTQELLTFLYISRGSSGETRSVLCLIERLFAATVFKGDLKSEMKADLKSEISNLRTEAETSEGKSAIASDLKSEISDLKSRAEKISRQLRAWCDSLQNSGIKGQRYLTKKTRRATQEAREREEFLRELEQIRSRKE